MKILHFVLFVLSPSVRKCLIGKGIDPDTVYLNDYKFMSKVFYILVPLIIYLNFANLDQNLWI